MTERMSAEHDDNGQTEARIKPVWCAQLYDPAAYDRTAVEMLLDWLERKIRHDYAKAAEVREDELSVLNVERTTEPVLFGEDETTWMAKVKVWFRPIIRVLEPHRALTATKDDVSSTV